MKILITGGRGYIAQSLYKGLRQKYVITITTRDELNLLDNQQTKTFFENNYFDVVLHTAAVGGSRLQEEHPSVLYENLKMYWNLIDNKSHFDRLITFGSGAEFDQANSLYGFSKRIISDSVSNIENYINFRIYAVFDENELDTRFIKSNILRYINNEPMIIHEDRLMDFFYMEDLIALVDYYLTREEWLASNENCVYLEKYKLSEIANIINNLNKHQVDVSIQKDTIGDPYVGVYRGLPIRLVGLKEGIQKTYKQIKLNINQQQ